MHGRTGYDAPQVSRRPLRESKGRYHLHNAQGVRPPLYTSSANRPSGSPPFARVSVRFRPFVMLKVAREEKSSTIGYDQRKVGEYGEDKSKDGREVTGRTSRQETLMLTVTRASGSGLYATRFVCLISHQSKTHDRTTFRIRRVTPENWEWELGIAK